MKRYSTCQEWAGLKEDPNGEWVKYSAIAALKKDAWLCTETLLSITREAGFWIRDDIEKAARRIIEATKEGE